MQGLCYVALPVLQYTGREFRLINTGLFHFLGMFFPSLNADFTHHNNLRVIAYISPKIAGERHVTSVWISMAWVTWGKVSTSVTPKMSVESFGDAHISHKKWCMIVYQSKSNQGSHSKFQEGSDLSGSSWYHLQSIVNSGFIPCIE